MLFNHGRILPAKHSPLTESGGLNSATRDEKAGSAYTTNLDTQIDESILKATNFTPVRDSKIYNTVRDHFITTGSRKINWNKVKRTTNLNHTPNQIKWRYKIILKNKNNDTRRSYSSQNIAQKQINKRSFCSTRNVSHCAKFTYLSKEEKIERIAAALQATRQQDYYNRTFFENLPEVIGIKEEWYWLRRFYRKHYREITARVENATKKRLFIDENSTTVLQCMLQNMYFRQRVEREMLFKSCSRRTIEKGMSDTLNNQIKATCLSAFFNKLPNYEEFNVEKPWEEPEWKEALAILSSREIYCYISEPRFWYAMRDRVKTSTTKTDFEYKREFYLKIVPARNVCKKYKLPCLNLSIENNESYIMIFHEVNKFGIIKLCIEQLLHDGLLCSKTNFHDWFYKFAMKIRQHDEEFFLASRDQLIGVQEIVKEFILSEQI